MFENTLASGTTPCRGDNDEPYSYEVAATSKEVVDSSRNDEETPDAVVFVQLTPADPQHGSDNHPIKHDYPPEAV